MEQNLQPQSDPLAEAIARRGVGQQVPTIPQATPPAPQQAQAPQASSTPKQEFTPTNSHDFVLSTLAEQLKNDHKLEMEKLKMSTPQMGGM